MIPAHKRTHTETATVQVCAEQASFIHYDRQDIFVRENSESGSYELCLQILKLTWMNE